MEEITKSNSVDISDDDLVYENDQHNDTIMGSLNMMRKARKLCDVKLVIGAHEVPVHRAVLASASSYMLELFQKHEEDANNKQGMCKLKDIDYESFQYLLDYMYTSRLAVPAESVKLVYQAAVHLKMSDAAQMCSQYLADNLSCANCLGVRQFAMDEDLKNTADRFIQENINEVTNSKNFFGLPRVAVEIIGADADLINTSEEKHMFELVLSWAKDKIDPEKPCIERLTEQVNIFNLNSDNTLTDYMEICDEREKEDMIQDYKKKAKNRKTLNKPAENGNLQVSPGNTYVRKFSINPDHPVAGKQWTVIATYQMKDKAYMALAMLHGTLAVMSIHYRETPKSTTGSGSEELDSPEAEQAATSTPQKFFGRHASLIPLANMSSARCGFGLCALQDKLVACGGYDRGECLRSVECYDMKTNKWEPLPEMKNPRGRFSVALITGAIFAVGGSNGHTEQTTVDRFDLKEQKWMTVGNASKAKVSQGVTQLNGKMYMVGGCIGQNSVADCLVFDPETKEWSSLPPMNTARYQAGVCSLDGSLYAIGGTDGWNCLNSVEIFDFSTNQWNAGPNLNVARRGAGCEVLDGKIYIIGGNDGQQSLKSVEILEPEKDGWLVGPTLSMPRANVAAAVYMDRIWAVGGFSGRKFLESMEYLNPGNQEWCSYMPVDSAVAQKKVQDCKKSPVVVVSDQNSNCLSNSTSEMTNGH